MELLTPDIRAWTGRSAPPIHAEVTRREIVKYALATEQRQAKYLAGDEAPPMFLFGLFRGLHRIDELGPDGIGPGAASPQLPLERVMAGGTRMRLHRPVRPGDHLVGTRTLADIYEKAGRQGPLIFVVTEFAVHTESGEPIMEEIQTRIVR
jgi:3-methylfumaryl-CoA hydratase